MRVFRAVVPILVLAASVSAAELKVKVLDPGAAALAGAQVALLREGSATPAGLGGTSAEGIAWFKGITAGAYRVRVLAAGFAEQVESVDLEKNNSLTVRLRLASAAETVVVTATRTPVKNQDSGASVASLDRDKLQAIQSVSAAESLRFLPGAVVNVAGRRGGLASLFVRGGESRYNKVIVDDVVVNDPGGTFDFGVVPMTEVDHVEFARGAQSTLYGSDAMTSVLQVWTRTGSTPVPELRFGAEGGRFESARGYASVSGANGPVDYSLFGEQFNTNGQGPNDEYSNSSAGANLGLVLHPKAFFRLRTRWSNNRTGVQSFWNFNGQALVPPDFDQWARQNNFLASADLSLTGPARWQHSFRGFEYHHRRMNVDDVMEPGRVSPAFGGFNFDFAFSSLANINRAGFEYQGDYWARSWARSTFGYQFEDENGFVGDLSAPPLTHGLRLNHAVYGQEVVTLGRIAVVAGARFVHNGSFGNKVVPRVALSVTALRGGQVFSGTRLRFSYATGIKEPRLEESFASGPFIIPNSSLKAEENRALEAGVQQSLAGGKYVLGATYYHNQFHNQIDFASDPLTFIGQYVNVNQARAQGAELELHGRPLNRLSVDAAYNYVSTQIQEAPFAFDPLLAAGQPLLRRPKHSGSVLFTYAEHRWGGNLGGSFVGRRPDSDFLGFGIDHAAGYARVDVGAWYAINSRVTAYVNVENALNKHYEEVVGYPALRANFRAGMRFRIGGE